MFNVTTLELIFYNSLGFNSKYIGFSSLIIVLFPCPVYTIVSSGNIINFFVIEFIISSKFPVGTSVLPHVPLKRVSPENSNFSDSQYRHEPPDV